MTTVRYAIETLLADTTFDDAVTKVTEALKTEGFGVLVRIDMKSTLAQKLGVEIGRYEILGACNPPLAHKALQAEAQVGLLLPCNVVVRESGEGVVVGIVDPRVMFTVADNPALRPIVTEVAERARRVIAALG